jgi:serine protease Do
MTGTAVRRRLAAVALAVGVSLIGAEATCALAAARQWSWLGVRIRDLTPQEMEEISSRHGLREGFGVVIVEVLEDTPASAAGLQNGDVVVAFEGYAVTETRLLQRLIAQAPAGTVTRLTVLRPEGRAPLTVRLVTMPRLMVGERVAAEFGFILREPQSGEGALPRPVSGPPAIAVVVRGSPAERAGLEVGDTLVGVGDRSVSTRDAAREALADAVPDRALRLTVRRGDRLFTATLRQPERP